VEGQDAATAACELLSQVATCYLNNLAGRSFGFVEKEASALCFQLQRKTYRR
jgi:hypothetical protein